MFDEIREVLKTSAGKILAIVALAASLALGNVTNWFTDWSNETQAELQEMADE